MRIALLGLAAGTAIAVLAAPAGAQGWTSSTSGGVTVHRASGHDGDHHGDWRHHDDRGFGEWTDGRSHRRRDGRGFLAAYAYDSYYEDNPAWQSDGYNDWWHDQPWRAYPRWVQQNRHRDSCDPDRMWWSGSGWQC